MTNNVKNKLIIFLSILLTILFVTPVNGLPLTSGSIDEVNTPSVQDISGDSGRIGLDSTASQEPTPTYSPSGYSDPSDEVKEPSSASGASVDEGEIISNPTDDPSDNDKLIWIEITGDDNADESPSVPSNGFDLTNDDPTDLDGSSSQSGSTTIGGDASQPNSPSDEESDVDAVFVASCSGLVNKEVKIDTDLELNIIGYSSIEVLSGNENLLGQPYFDGLDVFDRINLAIASSMIIIVASLYAILKPFYPVAAAVSISLTVVGIVIQKIIDASYNWITLNLQIGSYTITNPIRILLENIINPILKWVGPISEQMEDLSDFLQEFKDLTGNSYFKYLAQQLLASPLAIYAVILVLQRKDVGYINNYLINVCHLSQNTAQNLVSLLVSYDSLFVQIRDNIIGKYDLFLSRGSSSTALRNIIVEVDPEYQAQNGEYAAIIQIKAISAGNVFDTKKIGIELSSDCSGDGNYEVDGQQYNTQGSSPSQQQSSPTGGASSPSGSNSI